MEQRCSYPETQAYKLLYEHTKKVTKGLRRTSKALQTLLPSVKVNVCDWTWEKYDRVQRSKPKLTKGPNFWEYRLITGNSGSLWHLSHYTVCMTNTAFCKNSNLLLWGLDDLLSLMKPWILLSCIKFCMNITCHQFPIWKYFSKSTAEQQKQINCSLFNGLVKG